MTCAGTTEAPPSHVRQPLQDARGCQVVTVGAVLEEVHPSPWTAWSALSEQERRRVTSLAKQGRRHPDPAVASAAHAWAEVLLADLNVQHEERWWRRALGIPAFILLVETGLSGWFERRADSTWAQRVQPRRRMLGERPSGIPQNRC